VATRNVVFQTPTARISADKAVFNTKTQLGTFENAMGIAALGERGQRNLSMFGGLEPDVYFYGQTLEKIGKDKYPASPGAGSRRACSRRRAGKSSPTTRRCASITTRRSRTPSSR
jgi:hypothetical protein